jgi:UDP:flavonoid glycosyltransferase YjiC (YdhE family)
MRVLFTSLASPQHLRPMVPLAWALRSAGHEVVVASAPNMTRWATAFGLSATGFGEDIDPVGSMRKRRLTSSTGRPTPERYRETGRRIGSLAARSVDELLAFGEAWHPDVIVHCPMEFAGRVVAAKLGVPSVLHRWGVETFGSFAEGAVESLAQTCTRLDVDPARLTSELVADPCPASLQAAEAPEGWPMRYVPVNGATVLPPWVLRPPERRRVCVTFGNTAVSMGGAPMMRAVFEAFEGLDVEVIAAMRAEDRDEVGAAGDHIRIVESVPLELFLGSCALLVHHGGSGSSFAAIDAGCPQLVLPQAVDSYEFGDAIERQGSGHTLESIERQQDPAEIGTAVGKILGSDSYPTAAAALAAENSARPTPAQFADRLATYVG